MRTRTMITAALAIMVGIAPVAAQAMPAASGPQQQQGATVQSLSHTGGRTAFTHQLKSIQRLESRN
ncbi:MAG TPA: hypothetical protein PLV07_06325 [Acidiphilium sp.]|uniref:hypothetical protein n=1 Tax=unclassified Acidiphilium TaxID=2617493 RepID=UPI000BDBEAFA|nr:MULTISPECIES: hypothetical protein [unclassified Acidiphilium]OYV55888.1 MAG: hypothetical protein B7Z76_08315 [Acidiphilium sp. 20-67-58]HQT61133.1 hypothetical protein [Acidiphilium sp.]HQU11180.1 hypothetical protein [Acidiphilium sp.]